MENYIIKMITEKTDLEGKIKKSKKLIENNPFNMTKEEKNYLETQVGYMNQYLDILRRRIEIAKSKRA